ncbi:MAG: M23 family metallopeptidase [Thermotogae bacterium]|nr:M23 family metallopeptidase [Thermotogota bacterium]
MRKKLKVLQIKYDSLERDLKQIEAALNVTEEGTSLPWENPDEVPLPVFSESCDTPCALPVNGAITRGMHGDYHSGIDLGVPEGTAVFAVANGVVEKVGRDSVLGIFVRINHAKGYKTLYAHLKKALVKEGDSVKIGTPVGLTGSTGLSTGPHVHFEVYKDGKPVDPVLFTH